MTIFYCYSELNWLIGESNDCYSWHKGKAMEVVRAEEDSYCIMTVVCGFSIILKANIKAYVYSSKPISIFWSNNTEGCGKMCLVIFLPNTYWRKEKKEHKYITRETSLSTSTFSHTMFLATSAFFVSFSVIPSHHEIKVKASQPCHFIMACTAVKREVQTKTDKC